jgi:hypothetical protein
MAWVRVGVCDSYDAVEPIAARQSAVVELPLGTPVDTQGKAVAAGSPDEAGVLYKERMDFSIPVPPRERPYVVKVKVCRGQPLFRQFTDRKTGKTGVRDLVTTIARQFQARVK